MKKFYPLKIIILLWAIFILAGSFYSFFLKERPSVLSYDSLAKKEYIVNLIKNDAMEKNYTVFAYNPAIYTYDYSYLFAWLAGKDIPYDPSQITRGGRLTYLIIQKTSDPIFQDFINSRTPNNVYKTSKVWQIPDGTVVLKRELVGSN